MSRVNIDIILNIYANYDKKRIKLKVSAKTRYALAAVIKMAQVYQANERIALNDVAESLQISKIYLEQIFSLLKRGGVVSSVKGAQGGYFLTYPPEETSVYQVMKAIDPSLFDPSEATVSESAPHIEQAMQNVIFEKLDCAVIDTLTSIKLSTLVLEEEKYSTNYMYYL